MSSAKPITVLVVDDVKPILNELSNLLEESGILTLKAADGLQALKLFSTDAPDAVLMDGMLPKMSGFNACQQIKAMPGGNKTPVIMITGVYKKHKYRSDAIALYSADDYLHKPFQKQLILATLQKHIMRLQGVDAMTYEERLNSGISFIETRKQEQAAAPPPPAPTPTPEPEAQKEVVGDSSKEVKLPSWDLSKDSDKTKKSEKNKAPVSSPVQEEDLSPPDIEMDLPDPEEEMDERVEPPTLDRAHSVDFIPGKGKKSLPEDTREEAPEVPEPEDENASKDSEGKWKPKKRQRDVYLDHLLAPFNSNKKRRRTLPKGHQAVVPAMNQEPKGQEIKGLRARTAQLLREFMSAVEISPIFTAKHLFDFALNRDLARYNRFGEYFALVSLPLRHIAVAEPVEGVSAADALLEALETRLRDCDVMSLEVGGPSIHVLLAYATEEGAKAYLQQVTEMVHPGFLEFLRFRYATCPADGTSIADLFGALAYHEMTYSEVIEWAAEHSEDPPEPQKVAVAHALESVQSGLKHSPPSPSGLRGATAQPQPQPANAIGSDETKHAPDSVEVSPYEVDLDDDSTSDSSSSNKTEAKAKKGPEKENSEGSEDKTKGLTPENSAETSKHQKAVENKDVAIDPIAQNTALESKSTVEKETSEPIQKQPSEPLDKPASDQDAFASGPSEKPQDKHQKEQTESDDSSLKTVSNQGHQDSENDNDRSKKNKKRKKKRKKSSPNKAKTS